MSNLLFFDKTFFKSKTQNKMKLFLVNCEVVMDDVQYSLQQVWIRNHIVHAETELEAEEKVRNYWISQGEEYHYSYRAYIIYVEPAIL
jgi:hypothetical protein